MGNAAAFDRQALVRRGQRLEYFTVAWNSLEAFVSIVAGVTAVALVGFGGDSLIEVASREARSGAWCGLRRHLGPTPDLPRQRR